MTQTGPMFARRTRGLLELSLALLCVWAAYWHTPVGAILRKTVATVFGVKSSARPLLAYYSGSSTPHARDGVMRPPDAPQLAQHVVVTDELALGLGLHARLVQLPKAQRKNAVALALAHRIDPDALVDPDKGPRACAELIQKAARDLGGVEGAVLAAFAGVEPARYAHERAAADGSHGPGLEELEQHLPPGFDDPVSQAADALAFGVAYGLGWPVARSAPITSGFGLRMHPVLGTRKQHTGIDLGVPIGTQVRATADGVVRRASFDGVNGRVLIIDHGRGVTTAYCHNDALLVAAGDLVRKGDVISLSGNTGRSTGPHLHYQLELGSQPVDPLAFIPERPKRVADQTLR